MAVYWLLKEELGAVSYGLAEDKEDKNVPKGAEVFESERELNSRVAEVTKEAEKEFVDFFINEPDKLQKELDKEYEKEKEDKENNGNNGNNGNGRGNING